VSVADPFSFNVFSCAVVMTACRARVAVVTSACGSSFSVHGDDAARRAARFGHDKTGEQALARNLELGVSFTPISGKIDQAAGLIFRVKDANNDYVARANALENNVNLYHVTGGIRRQIAGVDVAVPTGQTQQLGVRIEGNTIKTSLDVKLLFEAVDRTIAGPGAVEIWTKADSVTAVYELAITVIRE
jgi:hypothetical protein